MFHTHNQVVTTSTEGGRLESFRKSVTRSSRSRHSTMEERTHSDPDQLESLESQQATNPTEQGTGTEELFNVSVDPVLEMHEEKKDEEDQDDNSDSVERLCAKFDFPCCGGTNQIVEPVKEEPVTEDLALLEAQDGGDIDMHKRSQRSDGTSLSAIVARMAALDVETADGDETAGDLSRDDGDMAQIDDGPQLQKSGSISNGGLWYKEPIYASLIAACISFTIATIVMIILLSTGK
jgi:hypothetical protein